MDAARSILCYTARQVDGTRLLDARASPVPSPRLSSAQPNERITRSCSPAALAPPTRA
jgi:hypothetical protein